MLVFHSHCQLGNQMFIYACAHSLAKKRNESYCLSELRDLKYFKLSVGDYKWNRLKYLFFKFKNKFKQFQFLHYQDNREDYAQLMLEDREKDSWYYGYFQGEKYFYGNKLEVKSRFQIKEEYTTKFELTREKYVGDNPYAIVHIRLNDYMTFGPDFLDGPDLTLPFSYYHELVRTKIPKGMPIVFLSDDIKTIKEEFSYVDNCYFSDKSVIEDLQFIMHAQICILSCSTFSWWGAWLNQNENKTIFIPEHFLGFKAKKEYPINIIPTNWSKINIKP